MDIDGNSVNDFAIGSPFDQKAVIVRSKPVILIDSFKLEFFGPESAIDPQKEGK